LVQTVTLNAVAMLNLSQDIDYPMILIVLLRSPTKMYLKFSNNYFLPHDFHLPVQYPSCHPAL